MKNEQLKPCPFCGSTEVRHSGGYVECMNKECVTLGPTGDTPEIEAEKWNLRSDPAHSHVAQAPAVPVELLGVEDRLKNGDGFWRSCSGCHETNEGAETGHYPYSKVLKCYLGAGCSECGGIGAVWDDADYGAMADAMYAEMIGQDSGGAPPVAPAAASAGGHQLDGNGPQTLTQQGTAAGADTATRPEGRAEFDDVKPLVDEWLRSRRTCMDGAAYGAAIELAAFVASRAITSRPIAPATESPLNGIPATFSHDEGAIARCSYCGRYSLDRKTLSSRQSKCECGEKNGWSGSFEKPGVDAKWSGTAPTPQPVAGSAGRAPWGGVQLPANVRDLLIQCAGFHGQMVKGNWLSAEAKKLLANHATEHMPAAPQAALIEDALQRINCLIKEEVLTEPAHSERNGLILAYNAVSTLLTSGPSKPMSDAVRECEWTYDDVDFKWDSACGMSWQFNDDSPVENGAKFCHGCGKKITIAARKAEIERSGGEA